MLFILPLNVMMLFCFLGRHFIAHVYFSIVCMLFVILLFVQMFLPDVLCCCMREVIAEIKFGIMFIFSVCIVSEVFFLSDVQQLTCFMHFAFWDVLSACRIMLVGSVVVGKCCSLQYGLVSIFEGSFSFTCSCWYFYEVCACS